MARPIVIACEDYGLAHGVCDAALDLVAMARISAIAVRPRGGAFVTRAGEIAGLDRTIGVGLSLDLATGSPLGFRMAALAGRLDRDLLVAAILSDLDLFTRAIGRPPDFVGSPGEIHSLPGIRWAVFLALEIAGLAGRVWLRDPSERLSSRLRRRVGLLGASGASALASGFGAQARGHGYETNAGYGGFIPRGADAPVPPAYERLAQNLGPAPLLVCRPGYRDATLDGLDPHAPMREAELFYLSSSRFADLIEVLALTLVPAPGSRAAKSG